MCDFDDEDECVSNGCCFDDTFEDSDEFPTCYLHDKREYTNLGQGRVVISQDTPT